MSFSHLNTQLPDPRQDASGIFCKKPTGFKQTMKMDQSAFGGLPDLTNYNECLI